METPEKTPREKLESVMAALGLTISAEFVPFSQSRNKAEKHKSLNWRVTVQRNGREILTTDYMAGAGHCPSAIRTKPPSTYAYHPSRFKAEAAEYETETGRTAMVSVMSRGDFRPGAPILPESVDVIWSLSRDSDVLDYGGFEDWAESFGYDSDSRSAESTYRACLEIALKLRNAIGEAGLEALREAGEDF